MTDHRPRVADHANQLNAFGFLSLSGSSSWASWLLPSWLSVGPG